MQECSLVCSFTLYLSDNLADKSSGAQNRDMGAPYKVQVAADHTLAKVLLEPISRATNDVSAGAPSCWKVCVGSVFCRGTSGDPV